jgi:succinoglycan biosynthesis protein ExoV
MQLINYCAVDGGNFGDDINLRLWHRLFPDLSKLKDQAVFYGVGTLLDGPHDKSIRKVVLGAGIGEVNSAHRDSSWDFRWVRGPRTAAEFGLSSDLGVGDPAILWPGLTTGDHQHDGPVGLIPHFATWDSFDWTAVAAQAGMVAINPKEEPHKVFANMRGCSQILAESLHGAICADAMGVPWAACILSHRFNEFKWNDWIATIHRRYSPLFMHRPLVRHISYAKCCANNIAKLIRYKRQTRHPSLRPLRAATREDVTAVANTLYAFGSNPHHFSCSNPRHIERQRAEMLNRCEMFARAYDLQFEPANSI